MLNKQQHKCIVVVGFVGEWGAYKRENVKIASVRVVWSCWLYFVGFFCHFIVHQSWAFLGKGKNL